MSSRDGLNLSPVWSRGDVIDQLIYQALVEDVGDAEPSLQVWENVYQQVRAAKRPPEQRVRGAGSFFRGLEVVFDLFLHDLLQDHGWEARLAERRPLLIWPGQFMLVA